MSDVILPVEDGGKEQRVHRLPSVSRLVAVRAASVPLWMLRSGDANHRLSLWK